MITLLGKLRLASLIMLATTGSGLAAPGDLAQSPLFLSNSVAPNVFLLIDDSSSMGWEILTTDVANSGRYVNGSNTGCNEGAGYGYVLENGKPECTAPQDAWQVRLAALNLLYYDPNRRYTPWQGADKNGATYGDMSITAARIDPYDPAKGTINLLTNSGIAGKQGWRYYTWNDSNDDSQIDYPGEVTIHWVSDLSDNEQVNFANWFSFHRSRMAVAKHAVGSIIKNASGLRLGYGVLNGDQNLRIANIADNHRNNLLGKLYLTSPANGTPLRQRLKDTGDYFETGAFYGNSGTSPILSASEGGACQVNSTVLMTDGFYNDSSPNIGNVDGNNGAPYADNHSNTLADVAMYYYERDLSGTLANQVPTRSTDAATHQHLNTYAIAFGLTGSLNPATTDINAPNFAWPDPTDANAGAARIDDLWHATINGRGRYFTARDPAAVSTAFNSAIADITSRGGSASAVALTAGSLNANTTMFTTRFIPARWSGDLVAEKIGANGLPESTLWRAAAKLDGLSNPGSRKLITYQPEQQTGISFEWQNLSESQKAALHAGDDLGEARLNYLRGARELEGTQFRQRSSRLGDIINSRPVYVGAPNLFLPDTTIFPDYSTFRNNHLNRPGIVYVGANDGMLHGFRADTGAEVLGYIPSAVYANLHELTSPAYSHRYFADGSPTVADAFFTKKGDTESKWHTVLAGAPGAGGRSLFALDITNPDPLTYFSGTSSQQLALWEFTSADDADLGYVTGKPVIALTNARDGKDRPRWAVIIGNGYNSDTGVAKLFVLFLDADLSNGWTANEDYIEISTFSGSDTNKNGLSAPAVVDTDGDGIVDRAYAGDLEGNMWAFDLSATSGNSWGVAHNGSALFIARNAAGAVQPITARPAVARHPSQPRTDSNAPNLMVFFGTGQYLAQGDLSTKTTQSFYGVWDGGKSTSISRSELMEQTIQTLTNNTPKVRITSNNAVPYGSAIEQRRYGWYIDLDSANAATGERIVANAVVRNDTVVFNTFKPNTTVCETGGESWTMFVKAVNGGTPDLPVVDISNDRLVDQRDRVVVQFNDVGPSVTIAVSGVQSPGTTTEPVLTDNAMVTTTIEAPADGSVTSQRATRLFRGPIQGRLGWRELRQR